MLELKDIKKDYDVAGEKVHALKGVSLAFRESEFVSVLGPSGCGKTTLLNIIGGLDHYTTGDLHIDGVSTKNYTGRDWDTYRNHRIGFVFQSYNLIPHQTIQSNVELALSISGVEKSERIRRAREALDKVGLAGLYNKKPNQLSGGQMQRVAIARALVNDPEILLADEPTGALDSETSVQIMDLIKEIATHCLVIMVTHNPDLAEKYSTRIIRLLDGEVLSDTNPFEPGAEPVQEAEQEAKNDMSEGEEVITSADRQKKAQNTRSKKSRLSWWNAFKLSARNLMSKLKRTILVCFAGSIGIIGVATVLAVSSGVQDYIEDMQDDMLSGNPVTISTSAFDFTSIMASMSGVDAGEALHQSVKDGYVNVDHMIEFLAARGKDLASAIINNNITEEYVSYVKAMPAAYYADITTDFGINLSNNLYTDFKLEGYEESGVTKMSLTAAIDLYTELLAKTPFADYSSYISMVTESFKQAPSNVDFILSQYEFVSDPATSRVATAADEIMIVVDDEVSLTDLLLAQFGYFSQDEFLNLAYKAVSDNDEFGDVEWDKDLYKDKFKYDELLGKEFVWYPNDTVFNSAAGPNPFTYNPIAQDSWTTGKKLKITAILKPKDTVSYGSLSRGFFYTSALTKEILEDSLQSQIVKYFTDHDDKDIVGTVYNGMSVGITYDYQYRYDGETYDRKAILGSASQLGFLAEFIPGMGNMPTTYTVSKRSVGGVDTPQRIAIYPTNFELKDEVCAYLDAWNGDGAITVDGKVIEREDREDITYTDNLSLIIAMISTFIDMITVALVAFTSLSLVVSTVMIAIITYVSVMERIKEIGVIRSLGGRKRDVSALFIAETFIIGAISGIIGIAVTYIIQGILNLIVGNAVGIYSIAALPIPTALIMIALSIMLTLVSGLIPARLAAKKDPVVALRSE